MKPTLGIHKMQLRGRRKRQIAVLLRIIVRSEKSRKQQKEMKHRQKYRRQQESTTPDHGDISRIRGSFQYSNASARRFPAIRNTDDNITAAITT